MSGADGSHVIAGLSIHWSLIDVNSVVMAAPDWPLPWQPLEMNANEFPVQFNEVVHKVSGLWFQLIYSLFFFFCCIH